MFGGSERLGQPIAFGIDDDVREGEAGQRIGGMKHREECRIGEDDPAVARIAASAITLLLARHRAERSRIDRLGVRWDGSFAVAVHGNSL